MHPHVHLVVKAEHEYDGKRLNPRKADLQRWREKFAQNLTELGVAAAATRRDDRGCVKTNKKTPIYRAAHRKPKNPGTFEATCDPDYGGRGFGLYAKKDRGRQTGAAHDRARYRIVMDIGHS